MRVLHCNPASEEYQIWLPYTWGRFREFCDHRSGYDLSSIEWLDPIYLGWYDVARLIGDTDFANVDVLLLSFYVWNEERQWEIAKIAREQNPNILILGGGPQSQYKPHQNTKSYEVCDYVTPWEGEELLAEILHRRLAGQSIADLDELDLLVDPRNPVDKVVPKRLKLMDAKSPFILYKDDFIRFANHILTITNALCTMWETNRGCPYKCSFCMINIINRTNSAPHIASADSNVFRWWEPEFIIQEFDKIAAMGVKNVKIADELFVLNPRHFSKVCELLIERDYGFNIWAYSRIDTCRPKYLETLKKAGVNWLGLGIENPNQTLRQEIHKDSFQEVKIGDITNNIREAGINVAANYIFGLPMDTEESMQETLDFSLENMSEMVNFYCAMAYPGSPLHLTAKENNWSLPTTYSGYSQHSYDILNLPNDNLTSDKILAFRDKAWMKYHTNPAYLNLLESKFGPPARKNVEDTAKIKLKRKLLGD